MTMSQICILAIIISLFMTFMIALIEESVTKRFTRKIRLQIMKNLRIEKDKKMLREVR